ncbi:hypothetical protein HCN44_005487 [Aphidius gifuensis]|uniref:IRS-type PTB domain-containing protein n=1 Tax=Aphidius gifuensis TaxID=684658 RepID=A0A834Y373_APHGI|nr:uncharacterized protein LOC122853518 [Aphidius gifuensis]KAF7997210.1 hypothetical protein HCN44_005487 [Aphidius gifuensis]
MVDNNCIIEGNVKFRDGKKWKSRWCVMRKLSPVADCLHLQLYGDSKDRYKQGQTKASLSLQHFLGIESGFTLDKESNTVAIICQDIVVTLAFDTRERLIQWQVKISTNLGDDQQFLVIISSAPTKAKLSNGPAHLHIQDRRFCLTTGIPARLIGVWEIGYLRRYGVIEGRFCFEGGSHCGRGEGLHVLITDQADDIVKTLQLAADGKLTIRKRPSIRDNSGQESPRRQLSRNDTRTSDIYPTSSLNYSTSYKDNNFDNNKIEISPCWSSTESQRNAQLEHDLNCRENCLTSELIDQHQDWQSSSTLSQKTNTQLERCASCISKLGAVSKTTTTTTTATIMSTSMISHCPSSNNQLPKTTTFDRHSLSSYSSSSHDSDYSANQTFNQTQNSSNSIQRLSPSPGALPPRPQKPSTTIIKQKTKPPMPLPPEQICTCKNSINSSIINKINPYDNYDIPKTILAHHMSLEPPQQGQDQYYDTPRKIKECLALPKYYPNYDTPHLPQAVVMKQCGCPKKLQSIQSSRQSSSGCPCHNVMSWAGFVLPYCRRGAGIESTGVTIHPIKLSGEGKMPVVNANGELSLYNQQKNNNDDDENDCNSIITTSQQQNNYENISPIIDTQPDIKISNYVNIDFSESLENYENSKAIIKKSGITKQEIHEIANDLKTTDDDDDDNVEKICNKCGHFKENKQDQLLLNNDKDLIKKKHISGYLTMQPLHNNSTTATTTTTTKNLISRICDGTKSSSNPTLFGTSTIDLSCSKKRSDSELRIPGSAMLSSPYLRRRLIDQSSQNESSVSLEMLWRKRSYSVESAHYLDNGNNNEFSSNFKIHKCTSETNKSLIINDKKLSYKNIDINKINDEIINTQPLSIKIRRSSSVPSKTVHNRDSSSSNDSGVSTGSLTHGNSEFVEFEMSLGTLNTNNKKQNILSVCRKSPPPICYHNSLPRKSKSSDPLKEIVFQFQKIKIPIKSNSADANMPTCNIPKMTTKDYNSPSDISGTPYIDSRSTSSGTSDMSDYIETLSLSSHSSTDTPDSLKLNGRSTEATTLRPRSGKEYYKIDRSILTEQASRVSSTTSVSNYANITPVLEKSESPSPGYMSSSPFELPQTSSRDRFLFPEVSDI